LLPFYGFDQNFIHRVLESLLLYMLIDWSIDTSLYKLILLIIIREFIWLEGQYHRIEKYLQCFSILENIFGKYMYI
jgi:hypothetical protein